MRYDQTWGSDVGFTTMISDNRIYRFLLFPRKDIRVRFDVAFTGEGQGFYFFIGEAF